MNQKLRGVHAHRQTERTNARGRCGPPARNHSVAAFRYLRTGEHLRWEEEHLTGIIHSLTRDHKNKIVHVTGKKKNPSKTGVDVTSPPPEPNTLNKQNKVFDLNTPFRHVSLNGSQLSGGQECFSCDMRRGRLRSK